MKNIILVRPQFQTPDLEPSPPFSLVTLAPYFEDAEVSICDLQAGDNFNQVLEGKPDLVCFSGFTSQLQNINGLARLVKHYVSNARTIAGGSGVTANPEYAKSVLKDVSLLVSGNGEEFAQNWKIYSQYEGIFQTKRFDWEHHLTPSWSLIDYNRYAKTTGFGIETSRGCPFNCVFCTCALVNGKCWRSRKPEDVVSELRFLSSICKKFYFTDDNATVDPKRWKELIEQIIQSDLKLNLNVPEGIQAHNLDCETLLLMKKAGFHNIYIGAESGVQRVLDDVIQKGSVTGNLKVEKIEEVVKQAVSIGLTVNCFFVIGIVGETLAEAKQTVEFAEKMRKLGAYDCIVRNAIPIQGTRMFNIAKEKGYLLQSEFNDFNPSQTRHLLKTPEWNPEQIEELVKVAQKQQAQHILKHRKGYMLKKGIPRLFKNPRLAFARLKQLRGDAGA